MRHPGISRTRFVGGSTQGYAFGSTLGYIPAAASRLKVFAIFSDQIPDIEKRISDR